MFKVDEFILFLLQIVKRNSLKSNKVISRIFLRCDKVILKVIMILLFYDQHC
jgi:hypothetical protein